MEPSPQLQLSFGIRLGTAKRGSRIRFLPLLRARDKLVSLPQPQPPEGKPQRLDGLPA